MTVFIILTSFDNKLLTSRQRRPRPARHNTAAPTTAEITEPTTTLNRALRKVSGSENASPAMNRLMVKPIPAISATP